MIFSEGSRYNKYESNTIHKRTNGPPILLSRQTKKGKGGIVTALSLPSGEKESVFCENSEATASLLSEPRSEML
jgi:hypothetical protein